MESAVRIPFFEDLAPSVFKYGAIVLVEFQAHSLWYETSYTLAAQALRVGIKTDFHTFQHPPEDVKDALTRLTLNVEHLEKEKRFRIIDSYTIQTGLGNPESVEPYGFTSRSLKMSDWMSQMYNVFNEPAETRLIHIDENDSILTNHNSEAEVLDFFRRSYTAARGRGFLFVYSLLFGVHSPSFYNQFESLADVVLDFMSPEESGSVSHLARVRIARGSGHYDSKWRRLRTLENGEVSLVEVGTPRAKVTESKRRLAAIMFTDIVGYSSLSQRSESLALKLLGEHRNVLRPFFLKYKGREVKTIGDSFLVEFSSALEAVSCASDIQKSIHLRNSNLPSEQSVELRIGIHLGDVIHEGRDVFGDAVNIASRIEPLAQPGGVCVSEQIFAQIKNKTEFPIVSNGTVHLKNIEEPVEVYRVVFPWEKKPRASG